MLTIVCLSKGLLLPVLLTMLKLLVVFTLFDFLCPYFKLTNALLRHYFKFVNTATLLFIPSRCCSSV